jgi:hypothetical protein
MYWVHIFHETYNNIAGLFPSRWSSRRISSTLRDCSLAWPEGETHVIQVPAVAPTASTFVPRRHRRKSPHEAYTADGRGPSSHRAEGPQGRHNAWFEGIGAAKPLISAWCRWWWKCPLRFLVSCWSRWATVWGHRFSLIKATVLGFLSCQDEDLMDACPPWVGQSIEFWKAHRWTTLGTSCPNIVVSDGIRLSVHPCFFRLFCSRRERREALLFVAIMAHVFSFQGEVRDEEWYLRRDLRIILCNDENCLVIWAACKWGWQTDNTGEAKSYHSWWKFKVWP